MIHMDQTGYENNINKNEKSLQFNSRKLLEKIKILGEEINNFPYSQFHKRYKIILLGLQKANLVKSNLKQQIEWVANQISKIKKISIFEIEELSLDSNQINEDLELSYYPDPNKLNRQEKQLLTVSSRFSSLSLKSNCSLLIDYEETTLQYQEMLKKKENCIQDLNETLKNYEEKVQYTQDENKNGLA